MSMRYPGGFVGVSPVTANYPSGVWTPSQSTPYQQQNVWQQDRYWPYTTMLLHGDGTNGAQNNTFLDSSSNNFTITRNGNTTQGAFTPYQQNGYWSNYFDGTGDYLTVGTNSAFTMGTGDFTIECWVYPTSSSSRGIIQIGTGHLNTSEAGPAIGIDSGGNWGIYTASSSGGTSSTAAAINTWSHLAMVRSSTTTKLYLNGQQIHSVSDSTNYSTSYLTIGGWYSSSYLTYGYISNVRVVKGTAVYTGAFTPPTAPLTAITNTSFLSCQSNRFIDNSTNAFAITRNGDTSVQAFQPFPGPTTWSAGVLSGSGYFDGSGDYLTVADNAAFQVGTGAFTIESWVYLTTTGTDIRIYSYQPASGTATVMNLYRLSTNVFALALRDSGGTGYTEYTTTSTVLANTWYHVAAARNSSGDIAIWVNGARENSTASSTQNIASGLPGIGGRADGNQVITGYISNLRLVKSDVYGTSNSTITIPTAPLTAITNTSFLCNFTNAGIYDNAQMNDLETVGNAQVSTSVVKYGTGSISLSASGNTLRSQYSNPSLSMGTGDFTIEGWVYFSSTPSTNGVFQMSGTSGGFVGNQTANLGLATNSSTTWQIYAKSTYTVSSATTIPVGSWIHFALVRSGTTTVLYINGTALITLTADSTNYSTPYIGLGAIYDATSYPLVGYIDDFRITKGYGRYITNFTPPPARLPNQ